MQKNITIQWHQPSYARNFRQACPFFDQIKTVYIIFEKASNKHWPNWVHKNADHDHGGGAGWSLYELVARVESVVDLI
jgi:hypothetical protein